MARARSIKPGFFTNEKLAELPFSTRLLYEGLWLMADRAGRLEDRPQRIKVTIFPYDRVNVERMLSELNSSGFIVRYDVGGQRFIAIPTFSKHQNPHVKEAESTIPSPCEQCAQPVLAPPFPERAGLTPDSGLRTPSFLTPDSRLPEPGAAAPETHAPENGALVLTTPEVSTEGWKERTFEEFWKIVWLKTAKPVAQKSWGKQIKSVGMAELVIAAAKEQGPRLLAEAARSQRGALHPSTWLNQGRWSDEKPPDTSAPRKKTVGDIIEEREREERENAEQA